MIRRVTVPVMIVLALSLAACEGAPPVIPTLMQLPSVTPVPPSATILEQPSATPIPAKETPTGEPAFVTDTPAPVGEEQPTAVPAAVTPTPDALPTATPEPDTPVVEPCAAASLEERLAGLDMEAVSATHEAFMTRLRAAAGELAGWTLIEEADPLAGMVSADALPLGSLRYQRDGGEALILVSAMVADLLGFYQNCIAEEAYLRSGDISEAASVAIERLAIGDQAIRARVEEPQVDDSGAPTGETISTTLYLVLTEDALIQYLSIPALDAALGREAVSPADAEALLGALVEAVRGLGKAE